MPGFMIEFNRFCGKHVGYAVLAFSTLLGSAATATTVYYLSLSEVVTAANTRSVQTQAELERHMSAEADYQREVRDLMRMQSNMMTGIQTDIAVLRERSERE